jgi:hypothetical protein
VKHHFGDFLDRSHGHWSIVPNRDRWAYHFNDLQDAPSNQSVLMVTKNDENWSRIYDLSCLEELTLHEPSKEQIEGLEHLPNLARLRITHARPKALDFLSSLQNLRELVLEYVSGVEQLEPLGMLPKLEALHLENLRRVEDFSGIAHSKSLKYISIDGTFDWSQPVRDLAFIGSLVKLEYLRLAKVRVLASPPALASLAQLRSLRNLKIAMNTLPVEDFAFIEANCPNVDGAVRPAYVINEENHRILSDLDYRASIPESEFLKLDRSGITADGERFILEPMTAFLLGKGTRTLSGKPENIVKKCNAHESQYRQLVEEYRKTA